MNDLLAWASGVLAGAGAMAVYLTVGRPPTRVRVPFPPAPTPTGPAPVAPRPEPPAPSVSLERITAKLQADFPDMPESQVAAAAQQIHAKAQRALVTRAE